MLSATKRLTFSMHEKSSLRAIVEAITNTTHSGNVYGDGIDILPAVGGACRAALREEAKKRLERYVRRICRWNRWSVPTFKKLRFINHQERVDSERRVAALLAKAEGR